MARGAAKERLGAPGASGTVVASHGLCAAVPRIRGAKARSVREIGPLLVFRIA